MPRTLRLQETIFPFGVGGIADIEGESFIAMDTTEWPVKTSVRLRCDRLSQELGVAGFKTPPRYEEQQSSLTWGGRKRTERALRNDNGLLYMRFPRWRFCEKCALMSDGVVSVHGMSKNICGQCMGAMIPMRFVAVCESGGHLRDVPWPLWVHRRARGDGLNCEEKKHLVFGNKLGKGESLRDIVVKCRACGTERSLGDLSSSDALKNDGLKCFGNQPWESGDPTTTCGSKLIAVQRGSTSLYKPELMSAIDIPEADDATDETAAAIENHHLFNSVRSTSGDQRTQLAEMIANDVGADVSLVIDTAVGSSGSITAMTRNLHSGEWEAFMEKLESSEIHDSDFDVRAAERRFDIGNLTEFHDLIPEVGLVHRIRMVTALRGFRRYRQESGFIPTDLGKIGQKRWLPAIEQFGEGMFLKFDGARVSEWESRADVSVRSRILMSRSTEQLIRRDPEGVPPRFIMLHTLAHLLIRQLEYFAGYPAASMSERIYAEAGEHGSQAGILITTGSGDSEGTLGGLVRLAEPDLLGRLLVRAIEAAEWCANDPICGENLTQGVNSANFAACHSCALLPETSCECNNTALDRRLVSDPDGKTGFFDRILEEARAEI